MYLTHLALTTFRNFTRLDIDVPKGNLLILGNNAQGKTSLLEAIYTLSTFTSFQAKSDRQLINFLALKEPLSVARIVADFIRKEQSHNLEIRIIKEDNKFNGKSRIRKEIFLDRNKLNANEAVGFWERMAAEKQGQAPPELLSTHPADSTRIRDIKNLIPEAMSYYKQP